MPNSQWTRTASAVSRLPEAPNPWPRLAPSSRHRRARPEPLRRVDQHLEGDRVGRADEVEADQAALIEPASVALHAIRLSRLTVGDVACVVMEAATATAEPAEGYLAGVRALCDRHGTLLVFDEMITGFRWSAGGAQAVYRVTPDLSCWGKAMGNGFPLSALAGRRSREVRGRSRLGSGHGTTRRLLSSKQALSPGLEVT